MTVTDFQSVRDLLHSNKTPPVEILWPARRPLSIAEAAAELNVGEVEEVLRSLDLALLTGRTAVIAVAGELNAGKTSLVGSFLTEGNRERLNRGIESDEATHRFTIWLPHSWLSGPARLELVRNELKTVFGFAPEDLSSDPHTARCQQRDRKRLAVPLLASDPRLDDLNIALLDCPDIQTAGDTEARIEALHRGSALCSGLIVVFEHRKMKADVVRKVFACLPKVRAFVAINLARERPADEIARQFLTLHEKISVRSDDVYVSYDYAARGYEEWAPQWDSNLSLLSQGASNKSLVPCFSQAAPDPHGHPSLAGEQLSITQLALRISPDDLERDRQKAYCNAISAGLDGLASSLEASVQRRSGETAATIQTVALAIRDFFPEELVMTKRVVESLKDAAKTALPLPLRACVSVLGYLKKTATDIVAAFKKAPSAEKQLKGRQSQELASVLKKLLDMQEDEANKAAQTAFTRFVENDSSDLASNDWARVLERVWENLSKRDIIFMVTALSAALLWEILVVVGDGGAVLLTVSGLLGVAIGLKVTNAIKALKLERVFRQQLSNFIAVSFDEIGLPRLQELEAAGSLKDEILRKLPDPTIPGEPNRSSPIPPALKTGCLITLHKERLRELITETQNTLAEKRAHAREEPNAHAMS